MEKVGLEEIGEDMFRAVNERGISTFAISQNERRKEDQEREYACGCWELHGGAVQGVMLQQALFASRQREDNLSTEDRLCYYVVSELTGKQLYRQEKWVSWRREIVGVLK